MVYGLPRLLRSLAMTKGAKDNDFFLFFVFALTFCGLWIASLRSQWRRGGCVYGLLRRFAPRNDEKVLSLRGLEKPVAISVWDTIIHSWNSFSFLWMNKIMVVCGLLRRFTPRNDEEQRVVIYGGLPPFVRGEVAKQQGDWERN